MHFGKLFWKLFLGNVLLMAVVLAASVWLIVHHVNRLYEAQLTGGLRAQALTLREFTRELFEHRSAPELQRLARRIGTAEGEGVRMTFVAADGQVLGDSQADPASMDSHAARPEVVLALRDGIGEDVRLSRTLGQSMKYFGVRVGTADAPLGVIRVSVALSAIGSRTGAFRSFAWGVSTIAFLAAIMLALGLAHLWSSPIRRIAETARSLSHGDLAARAQIMRHDELGSLAYALHRMRDHLASQLEVIDRQRRTLQSLVAQLHEGVVVAGPDGRIVLMNPAARRLLGLPAQPEGSPIGCEGRAIEECIAQHDLQQMLLRRPGAPSPDSTEDETRVELRLHESERWLLARASDILLPEIDDDSSDSAPPTTGRVLVLTDITALNKTIQVKADFAANASHELRTPLSAIRAAADTLARMDLAKEADSATYFLEVISRHVSRMEAMVADLLNLSRIESSPSQFRPQEINLRELTADLHARFAARLQEKQLHWVLDLPPECHTAEANLHLLRLTLDNLVDNAIKFTDAGGHIQLGCRVDSPGSAAERLIVLTVTDDGCGIPEEEQARVFERFYQVERARSGSLRGTGLGLSIVRHAVAAMRGTVELVSRLGAGTSVTIRIPQKAAIPVTTT